MHAYTCQAFKLRQQSRYIHVSLDTLLQVLYTSITKFFYLKTCVVVIFNKHLRKIVFLLFSRLTHIILTLTVRASTCISYRL